ncbi:MAG: type II toxin-antitoxin system VapC family toxin [Lentisphaerae bacterium]|jgi:predicted nucleic acid-binding protein|nr:type II toxin-antitoxin system VapC family toxin [Lentisphaerota bacterium]MBT5611662.1 type II toxin-antitoxin system VapC family toxin [Lentisphaerota bacterium]MBT7060929.1 type II toxin-antitoxin system VapC family toxin [Lentisphaerota bacterium]MBT7842233.1 type II toxin-antitoxin system VapC family toxin [Lentisphaerota bacterium]
MIAVLDTSAFLRLFIPDGPVPPGLEQFMRGVERGENTAIAPELMLVEAGNVANKKRLQGVLSAEETLELVQLMCEMPVRYLSHRDLIEPAVRLASEHALTVYDALYLALARLKGARLFTADGDLARAAGNPG